MQRLQSIMTDIRLITIVGIRHYVRGDEAIALLDEQLCSATMANSLLLVPENENVHAPNRAVAAYVGSRKIGYVTETDIPYARAAIGDDLAVEVPYAGLNEKHTALFVTVEYDEEKIQEEYTPLFSLPPISGITLPRFDVAHTLLCARIMESVCNQPWLSPEAMMVWESLHDPEHPVYSLAREFADSYGMSLSGDDTRVYSLLMETPALPDDVREKLQHTHHHFAATETLCLRVWQREYRRAEKILTARNGLWKQIEAQLEVRTQTSLSLEREARVHLTALPYDLFTLHQTKPSLFASRLYCLHLSAEELDALMTYIFVYEKIHAMRTDTRDAEFLMPLYGSHAIDDDVLKFKGAIRRYVKNTNHQTFVPGLVDLVIYWERQGVVPRRLGGNITAYCKSLMANFGCKFDIPNFRKYYRLKKQKN